MDISDNFTMALGPRDTLQDQSKEFKFTDLQQKFQVVIGLVPMPLFFVEINKMYSIVSQKKVHHPIGYDTF